MPAGQGTVAYAEVDGRPVLGVNSRGRGFTEADRVAADQMRDILIARYPGVMATDNIGRMPNNALYHAEVTLLLRAAREFGSLQGRTIEVTVDREVCGNCGRLLPLVARQVGNPTITFVDHLGARRTLRNGRWE